MTRTVVVLVLLAVLASVAVAQDKTATGFVYPLGSSNTVIAGYGSFGATADDGYFAGKWHDGADLRASVGDTVYAIADGVVLFVSDRAASGPNDAGSGWSDDKYHPDNFAYVCEHRLADGSTCVAVYGHLSLPHRLNVGNSVSAGQPIGEIGKWRYGVHLHFGICQNRDGSWSGRFPQSGFGMMPYPPRPDAENVDGVTAYGNWLDPLAFITHRTPEGVQLAVQPVAPAPNPTPTNPQPQDLRSRIVALRTRAFELSIKAVDQGGGQFLQAKKLAGEAMDYINNQPEESLNVLERFQKLVGELEKLVGEKPASPQPNTPQPQPTPTPTINVPNIAGTWVGAGNNVAGSLPCRTTVVFRQQGQSLDFTMTNEGATQNWRVVIDYAGVIKSDGSIAFHRTQLVEASRDGHPMETCQDSRFDLRLLGDGSIALRSTRQDASDMEYTVWRQ